MRSYGSLALLVLLSCAGAAMAASQGDHDACDKSSGDATISACTRVIEDRGEDARRRAAAYYNRGSPHLKGDPTGPSPTSARPSVSIRNAPTHICNRALAYRIKNDVDRALPDYNDTIRARSQASRRLHCSRRGPPHAGRLRPRHRRLQSGHPARQQIRPRHICRTRRRVFRQERFRSRHRRLRPALKDNPKNAYAFRPRRCEADKGQRRHADIAAATRRSRPNSKDAAFIPAERRHESRVHFHRALGGVQPGGDPASIRVICSRPRPDPRL